MGLAMRNLKYHFITILISVLILGISSLFAQPEFWMKDTVDSNGNAFRLKINQKTGSPHRVYGMKANLNDYGSINAKSIEGLSRQFIADKSKTLRVKSENLKVKQLSTRNGKWMVEFQQTHKGVPVYGAYVGFTLNEEGKIISLGSDSHSTINLDVSPAITAATALDVALLDFGDVDSVSVRKGPDLVVLPNETDKGFNYQLAYYAELISKDPNVDKADCYFINAEDGDIIGSASLLRYYNIWGKVQIKHWPQHDYDTQATADYKYGKIGCVPIYDPPIYDYTNSNGNYAFTGLPYGTYLITADLYGTYVDINESSTSHSFQMTPGGAHNWTWNASNGTNVYYHANKMHDWIKASPFNYTGMDYRMEALVNAGSGQSHYSGGNYIRFGTMYGENWARSSDMVLHEYAHCIIWKLYGDDWIGYGLHPPLEAEAMDDGLAMYFAATINNDSEIGESVDLEYDLSNDDQFNDMATPYENGTVIGGACWDLRQSGIGTSYVNELVFDALEMTPHAYDWEDFAENIAIADDNDGNLNNSVPHYYEILDAFEDNHNIDFNVSPPPPIESVTISGPSYLPFKESAICTANVSGGSPPISYQW